MGPRLSAHVPGARIRHRPYAGYAAVNPTSHSVSGSSGNRASPAVDVSASQASVKAILYVQHYPDGGSVTGLLDLVRSLDRARFRPVVAFLSPNAFLGEFESLGVNVHVLTSRFTSAEPPPTPVRPVRKRRRSSSLRPVVARFLRRDWPAAKTLCSIIRSEHIHLVHANNDVLSNRDAVIASILTRTPLVVHVRWLHRYKRDASWALDVLLARRARQMIFMSHAIAGSCQTLHVPERRQIVLDDPFRPADYTVTGEAGSYDDLGIPAGAQVILHIGRIVPWKGQHVLIDAMAMVRDVQPHAVAVLIGAATDLQGSDYEQRLKQQVADLHLGDHVVFAGARRDIPAVLAMADVVVHSSTTPEPFGRVVVEAMAAGRPVVAADEGGVPEIIDDGRTGRLVAPRDPALLAEAILAVIGDPEGAAVMGRCAQQEILSRFSLGRHGTALAEIYDRILDGP